MKRGSGRSSDGDKAGLANYCITAIGIAAMAFALAGCGTGKADAKKNDYFTSGSREADQRASQTMARHEQLTGSGEGAGEKGTKKAAPGGESGKSGQPAQVEGKLSLFERLGGEKGISNIVADFLPRVLQDPRVNWQRKGVEQSKFSLRRRNNDEVLWNATPENTDVLRKHFIQFVGLATGGPANYDGKEMKSSHANMHITNPEFDAVIGDLKASLDKLQIPNKEQKELLAIIESTRPQIVTER